MADEIQIWAIDEMAESTKVEPTSQTETEKLLEDALVKRPDMLMPGLTLVGRQTPNAGGYLDLLGVDEDGRLVVFELKRGTLTRDVVTQVIDYSSALESMSDDARAAHIAERSGQLGITKIENFEEWYREGFGEQASLTPVRMMLVGLGIDDNASRMVDFLAKRDVDITLLTFYGYQYDGKTLLAKQVQQAGSDVEPSVKSRPSNEERRKALVDRAEKSGMDAFWKEVTESFTTLGPYNVQPLTDGFTFYLPPLKMQALVNAKTAHGSHSVRLDENSKKIRITFFPAAIHLCEAKFKEQNEVIQFKQEAPRNVPQTTRVSEQWYCLLDAQEWAIHKDALTTLASTVSTEWDEARRSDNQI